MTAFFYTDCDCIDSDCLILHSDFDSLIFDTDGDCLTVTASKRTDCDCLIDILGVTALIVEYTERDCTNCDCLI